MKTEEIQKCIDLIGKEVFVIANAYDARPYVKAVKITSVEFYGKDYAQLKTPNEGSFQYGWGRYYETYEDAEKRINEYYKSDKTKFEPLKQCPMCNSSARISQYANKYQIECAECGLATRPVAKLKEAIDLWNGRKERTS